MPGQPADMEQWSHACAERISSRDPEQQMQLRAPEKTASAAEPRVPVHHRPLRQRAPLSFAMLSVPAIADRFFSSTYKLHLRKLDTFQK